MVVKLININAVVEQTTFSKGTIYKRVRANKFPKPVKVSEKCTRWYQHEIDDYLLSLREGSQGGSQNH